MTRPTRARAALTAAVLCAVAALAGCTADTPPHAAPAAKATTAAPSAHAPADTSCQPRRSLRPSGGLPQPGHMPAGSYMAQIQKKGRLVLGTSQDTLLFSSRNPFTGAVEGFDVDMGHQIAEAIFGDPDKLTIKVIPNEKRVDDAADGTVDLVAYTMTINCARWKRVNFSTVYYDAGQKVLVSTSSAAKGIGDLGGKRVCAPNGSTSLDNIAKAPSKPVAVGRASFGDCLVAFQQNEVDAISTDDTILAGLAAQDPYAHVVGDKFTQEPYGLAMSQQHPEFTRFVNAVLERNRANGTWKRTYDRWLGRFGPAPQPPAAEYRD
ncbi:glutamate ABC transporter substrate-binding protein [Krasilnikovia sp. MM14-A1004]|uniref:glutamate ABC transporter substrate-binding protein n=1 Tax=Krasilnikovia sp. MM14-A1004 TaxID=3373541 RepID=UPI00399D1634